MDPTPVVTEMSTITSAMLTGFSDFGTDIATFIGGIIPIVLPIVCGILAVTIGIKVFKRIAGKA